MTPLLEAARDLQDFFTSRQWRFCIIGGLALLRWGEPRFTRDVDVSLFCGFGREEDFIDPILASGYRGPQDLLDVETVAVRQRHTLDWAFIEKHLVPLAEVKAQPAIMETFARLRDSN